jgi:hypothetical protein
MELNDNALITWDFLQTMMPDFAPDQKDRVIGLINWISSRAVTIAGREIIQAERTLVLSGNGTPRIYLPVIPVSSIASLKIDENHVFDTDTITAFHLEPSNGVVTLYEGRFPSGVYNVQVVYTAGYTLETMPEEIKKACLEAIQTAWNRQQDNSFGVSSKSNSNGTNISYEPRLSADVYGVFADLRLAVM